MRIRKYMVVGVLSIVVFPWMVYFFIHFVGSYALDPYWQAQNQRQTAEVAQVSQMIAANEPHWTSAAWQTRLRSYLTKEGISVVINATSGDLIFSNTLRAHRHWMPTKSITVIRDNHLAGSFEIYGPAQGDARAAIGAALATVLAITFVGFQIRRNVIRPLEAMSHAALQIAEGELNLHLPKSRAIEIAQVRTAFEVMVKGLKAAFAEREKLEDERRFFIGAIAHDLRTPLFSLRGYLDGLAEGIANSPEKAAKYVSVCQEKAAHLDRLVSDLFAFTRLEYMDQTLLRKEFDVNTVVKSAVDSVLLSANSKHVAIQVHLPSDACVIRGDAHLLERAITNLMDNAIRYTPQDGTIGVSLQADLQKVTITVRDSGPGISETDLAHIFEPMYRGDASRNLRTGGAGLGLTIAKRVFSSHGGELTAQNAEGGGALLTGWIPRA